MATIKILQLSHGKIIPDYISAYAMRVNHLLEGNSWKICSVGGIILHDIKENNIEEYRSLMSTTYSVLKGNRSLEIAISKGILLRKKYINSVRALISEAEAIIFEGPWEYPLFEKLLENKFVVYDAHNVESLLRTGNKYHDYTEEIEGKLVQRSNLLISVSENDLKYFKEKFNPGNAILLTHLLKNVKYQWNGEDSRDIIFIGSIYGPNIEAVEFILSLARTMPDFQFHIIGNVNTHGFPHKPGNVQFHGLIQDAEKDNLFGNSCIALNPIFTGGGRNVKMIDYIMHGLPVISTEIGIRGLSQYDLSGAVAVEKPEHFKETILKLTGNRDKLKSMSENTFKLKEKILATESSFTAYEIISKEYEKWKSGH
ncbi:glycosyltransferase [Ferroplasma acidiphilum]|uniref:glycosyltransferase n=1 Tax=Ferroplasma acidiphilum TaxID=74969 RepID=UPI0023F1AF4F|nr:glycosyltransferase [Ferroplasma acidiphilum]